LTWLYDAQLSVLIALYATNIAPRKAKRLCASHSSGPDKRLKQTKRENYGSNSATVKTGRKRRERRRKRKLEEDCKQIQLMLPPVSTAIDYEPKPMN